MSNKNNNGRITLAVLKQKVEDYSKHNDLAHIEIKADIKEIKDILVNGSSKIAENRFKIENHLKEHKNYKEIKNSIWIKAGIIGGIVGTLASVLKTIIWR